MHYQLSNYSTRKRLKLISIIIVTFLGAFTGFSQQNDTIRYAERVVIKDDLVLIKPYLPKLFPKYLKIGDYTIIVESFSDEGIWNARTRTYEHLSGIGRVCLNCPSSFSSDPVLWRDATIMPVRYKVVDKPIRANYEVSAKDLARINMKSSPNSYVELMIPHYNGKEIDISSYIDRLADFQRLGGVPVRFDDLTVKVEGICRNKGLVLEGSAEYPLEHSRRPVKITLGIHPGFSLEISAIVFTPKDDPLLDTKLLLPASITQKNNCARAYLDLGKVYLRPNCEIYKELPSSKYGSFGIGNTTMSILGDGYIVDFSITQTHASIGKPGSWKGVILLAGESSGVASGLAVSNIGYLQAPYSFSNGIIESSGLIASFDLVANYSFKTTQPYGYTIDFNAAEIDVSSSKVVGGAIQSGSVTLPISAVRQADDSAIELSNLSLSINSSMDLLGGAYIRPQTTVYWGDLIGAGGSNRKSFGATGFSPEVKLFFAAEARLEFIPTTPDGHAFNFPHNNISADILDSNNIQGATIGNFEVLVVNTPDFPDPLNTWIPDKPAIIPTENKVWYRLDRKRINCWINVATEGVNCSIKSFIAADTSVLELGNTSRSDYVGIEPFKIIDAPGDSLNSHIVIECIESAVMNCDYSSFIWMPEPTKSEFAFSNMFFTSTANNAGGDLMVENNDSLSYWGLELASRPGYSSAGLVCVKTGQIIVTAAGLAERRHFSEPFWLTWGELLANGSVGRLFFDYNAAGQEFDSFNYLHEAVALSQYDPREEGGFLRVGGNAFFPLFGADYLHIKDHYDKSNPDFPFHSRVIELSDETLTGFSPSDQEISGNWMDGLGIFNFSLKYADETQDGFLGSGSSSLRCLLGGELHSFLDMNSRGTSIRIGSNLSDQRSVSFGQAANITDISRIWGCVSINDYTIENIVIGGEVSKTLNVSVLVRAGTHLSASLQITPALARLTMDGEAYLSILAGLDVAVDGHMQLTLNHGAGYVEGEFSGEIRAAEGAVLVGSSIEAEGQLNWHLGTDFVEIQGFVALDIMGFGGGSGVGAGLYIGVGAPKGRAWVLSGQHPRYSLRVSALPPKLTGVYGFVQVHQGINLYIVSGGYDVYLGFGAFLNPTPLVVGNLGGRIYGEILGGLVSAAAYFNCQLFVGLDPIGFEGTVGLEACAAWVICGSVDLTIGLNSNEGFYIE